MLKSVPTCEAPTVGLLYIMRQKHKPFTQKTKMAMLSVIISIKLIVSASYFSYSNSMN